MGQKSRQKRKAVDASTRTPATGPFAGRPIDGGQYFDVVEEQEYADRRPTQEEQRPRYSYLKNQAPDQSDK